MTRIALRNLCLSGDPILRKPCRTVETIDDKIRLILSDMAQTMLHTGNAAGLAANQVGVLKRLVVINMGGGFIKLVNPELVNSSGRQDCVEGCLSLPGRWVRTKRPYRVTVRFQSEWGAPRTITGEGELAKCLCHELDHLDGILMTDRAVQAAQ